VAPEPEGVGDPGGDLVLLLDVGHGVDPGDLVDGVLLVDRGVDLVGGGGLKVGKEEGKKRE